MDNEKLPTSLKRTIVRVDSNHMQDIDCSDDDRDFYPPSPLSSSPPRDFNIHPDGQYMPILDDDDDEDRISRTSSSSSSSSSSLSSGSCTPLSHALFGSGNEGANASNSGQLIRCPVCEKPMRTFYCAKCIQMGRFVTLDPSERDIIASDSMLCVDERKMQTAQIISENQVQENSTEIKLRELTRKTEALKELYEEHQNKLSESKALLERTRKEVEVGKKAYRDKKSKIDLMKRFIANRKSSVKKRKDSIGDLKEEVKQHVTRRAYQLTRDVFPIDELNLHEQNSSFVNMETSPLLTFSDGSHHQIEQTMAYCIVEPWLPSTGDYSAYSLWVNDNSNQLQAPMEGPPDRNSAFRIGAALGYTTQLVNNLASCMNVILPAKLDFDVFNRDLLNDGQFSYNVAKLNTNVIHLCVTQGIDISLLSSHRTLKNLLLLFDLNLCDLGREPILDLTDEEDDKRAGKLESQLINDISLVRDDFYDFNRFSPDADDEDEDVLVESEWEISENITPIDLQMAEQSMQQDSYISRPLRLLSSFWTASSN